MAPNWGAARKAFDQAFHSNPLLLQNAIEERRGHELTALGQVTRSSPVLDAYRQAVPRWAGGYRDEDRQAAGDARRRDPVLAGETLQFGHYPNLTPKEQQDLSRGMGRALGLAAQGAGAVVGDAMGQRTLNIWWLINAAQAAAMLGQQVGLHGTLHKVPGAPWGSPFDSAGMRIATAMPSILAVSAATGSLLRQPGYAAVLPSEEDRTRSEDPLMEGVYRNVLARNGALLPWSEFSKERPDVSRSEYESYKAYLFGDKSPIKATADGIHGPELTFLGKSVPLLTGVLPLVGGVIGGRMAVRRAGERLAADPAGIGGAPVNQFHALTSQEMDYRERLAKERSGTALAEGPFVPSDQLQALGDQVASQKRMISSRLGRAGIVGASAGIGITAAAAGLLETMRRSAKARDLE
jgi:hypothetical protein